MAGVKIDVGMGSVAKGKVVGPVHRIVVNAKIVEIGDATQERIAITVP